MAIPEGEVKRELIYRNNGQNFPSWKGKCTIKFKKLKPLIRINLKSSHQGTLHIPLMLQWIDPVTSHMESEILKVDGVPEGH